MDTTSTAPDIDRTRLTPRTTGTAPMRNRPVVRVRWDALLTSAAALILGIAIGVGIGYAIAPAPIPPCSDAVADARGICYGPLID